jgi:hypothetical protein
VLRNYVVHPWLMFLHMIMRTFEKFDFLVVVGILIFRFCYKDWLCRGRVHYINDMQPSISKLSEFIIKITR